MDFLGAIISALRHAYPVNDLIYEPYFKKGCATHILISNKLNQATVIKIPSREHYITKSLAHKYLEASRLLLQQKLGLKKYQQVYILNVLISDKISKSCYELVKPPALENMDMIFNSKKLTKEEILAAICKALSTKFSLWAQSIKKTATKPKKEIQQTRYGIKEVVRRIKPYGPVLEQIRDIEQAADRLKSKQLEFSKKKAKK